MARLTNWHREKIVAKLQDPVSKKIGEAYVKVGALVDKFIAQNTPGEIVSFHAKYPDLFKTSKDLWSGYLPAFKDKVGTQFSIPLKTVYIENAIPNFYKRFCQELESSITFLISEISGLEKLKKEIKGKSACVLENINTFKQLEEQFPEAYEILLVIEKKEKEKEAENGCDTIENLRAQLSKLKK